MLLLGRSTSLTAIHQQALQTVSILLCTNKSVDECTEQVDQLTTCDRCSDSLDWTQEKVAWGYSMNSQERILRTVTAQQKHIPALPMYAQMSIWPGGASKSAGTRGWAGMS